MKNSIFSYSFAIARPLQVAALASVGFVAGCQTDAIRSQAVVPAKQAANAARLSCTPSVDNPQVVLGREITPVWLRANNAANRLVIPDGPVRAYRIGDKTCIHITHYLATRVCGASLADLDYPGEIVYRSPENPAFPAFDYHNWLMSPYALSDSSLIALAHSEWYDCLKFGEGSPLSCAHPNYQVNSWLNAVTAYQSIDSGASWHRTGVVESIGHYPEAFENIWMKRTINYGFFHPSNIVREGNRYYAFVRYTNRDANTADINDGGIILISTADPHSAHWQQVTADGKLVSQPHRGTVIPGTASWDHVSVTWNEAACQYLILFWDYAQKRLMSTTAPSLAQPLFSQPLEVKNQVGLQIPGSDTSGLTQFNYPSAHLDPDSTSRNFETTDSNFFLFPSSFTKTNALDRSVFRIPAQLVNAGTQRITSPSLNGLFQYRSQYFYSNGKGHYCAFKSRTDGERITKQSFSAVAAVYTIPANMALDGFCKN